MLHRAARRMESCVLPYCIGTDTILGWTTHHALADSAPVHEGRVALEAGGVHNLPFFETW